MINMIREIGKKLEISENTVPNYMVQELYLAEDANTVYCTRNIGLRGEPIITILCHPDAIDKVCKGLDEINIEYTKITIPKVGESTCQFQDITQ